MNAQHDPLTATRRVKTWRVLGIDRDGDAVDIDTYDVGPVEQREAEAMRAAREGLGGATVATVLEAGWARWTESDGKIDDDLRVIAVFGDRSAAVNGGWV